MQVHLHYTAAPLLLAILAVLVQAQVQAHVGTDTAAPLLLVILAVLVQAQVQAHVGKDTVGIFENALKKAISHKKRHFCRFLTVINFFLCIFKNIDENNIFGSIVFKAKAEKKFCKKIC